MLSAKSYNKLIGLALVCPVTNRSKGYPFEVALPPGLPVQGVVLSDHIKSQDWRARNAEFIGKLDNDTLSRIVLRARSLLATEDE